jgi:hypothetical protein
MLLPLPNLLADHDPSLSPFLGFGPEFHQLQRLAFFVVSADEKGLYHLVDNLLGLPVELVVFTNGEVYVACALVPQLE